MNTATLILGKAKSGLPAIPRCCTRHPEIPALTRNARNRHSVLRLLDDRMQDIIRERVVALTESMSL